MKEIDNYVTKDNIPNEMVGTIQDTTLRVREYLEQIGKLTQIYWGTAYPKHFIRTFSEIEQLLKPKGSEIKGLCISIIDEDNLQKVRLEIVPYKEATDDPTQFFITHKVLNGIIGKFEKFDPSKLDSGQALGLAFCIGKFSTPSEEYDYHIIVQVVDLLHNRIVNENALPIVIPTPKFSNA